MARKRILDPALHRSIPCYGFIGKSRHFACDYHGRSSSDWKHNISLYTILFTWTTVAEDSLFRLLWRLFESIEADDVLL